MAMDPLNMRGGLQTSVDRCNVLCMTVRCAEAALSPQSRTCHGRAVPAQFKSLEGHMFDKDTVNRLLLHQVVSERREAVGDIVRGAIRRGTFSYTDLLCAAEPWRTIGLETIDGIRVSSGGMPQYNATVSEAWGGRPVVLAGC